MGMQVHFKLSGALASGECVTISSCKIDEQTLEVCGSFTQGQTTTAFNIEHSDGCVGDDCWADVVHNRTVVDWLIDNRIPFICS